MPNFAYPLSAELQQIDPVLFAQKVEMDPMLGPNGIFPMRSTDQDALVWEQRDNYLGLMQFRGLNGDPPRVKRIGSKRYRMEPGYYGEFTEVDEMEMTRRAAPATWAMPIKVDDLVSDCQDQLMTRQTNRMRWIVWTLLTQGIFVVLDKDGAIGAQDSYKLQKFTPLVPLTTFATATPLGDLRQIPILGRGQSVGFGSSGELWMNQATFNAMIANRNPGDLYGEKLDGLRTVQSAADVNLVLNRNNLPMIRIYEEGYYDDSVTPAVFRLFLPDGVAVYVGRRSNGAALGEFRLTKNVSAPTGMGMAVKVVSRGMADDEPPPAKIEVHRLFNGGPVLYYAGSLFVIQWY